MMKIYPFPDTDEAYADLLALRSLLDPEVHLTIDLLRAEAQEMVTGNAVTRVLGSIEDRVVASGGYWHSTRTADGPYSFNFSVHPAYQTADVPAQMHRYLLASMAQAHPTAIVSQVTEDAHYRVRLLEADHFALKMRFPRARLPVMSVETAAYAEQLIQLAAQGIEFVTLRDMMKADADWQHNVWRLYTRVRLWLFTRAAAESRDSWADGWFKLAQRLA